MAIWRLDCFFHQISAVILPQNGSKITTDASVAHKLAVIYGAQNLGKNKIVWSILLQSTSTMNIRLFDGSSQIKKQINALFHK